MITTFQTYLLFQLDALNALFMALAIITVPSTFIASIFYAAMTMDGDEDIKKFAPMYRKLLAAAIATSLLATFTPTTQTAAAMIVLPAITSDKVVETVTPEAKEIYDLAKQALRNLAEDTAHAKTDR